MRALGATSLPGLQRSIKRFVRIGIIKRENGFWEDAIGRQRPVTIYAPNERFFAYRQMRAFVGKLMRRVHPDILGLAQALGKRGMRMLPEQSRKLSK